MTTSSEGPTAKRQRTSEEPTGTSASAPEAYTIFLRGNPFELTRSEIEFDSPNFFTSCFLSGFAESNTRKVYTDRSPALFPYIRNWLSGYDILPLPTIPEMVPTVALKNLIKDAQYFGLSQLEEFLTKPVLPPSLPLPPALNTYGFGQTITFEDFRNGKFPLERCCARYNLAVGDDYRRTIVPLEGETVSPLIYLENVQVEIEADIWSKTSAHLTISIPFLEIVGSQAFAAPNVPPGVPPPQFSSSTMTKLRCGPSAHTEVVEDPNALLSLDGISTTFMGLGETLLEALPLAVGYENPNRESSTLEKILVEHLRLSDRYDLPRSDYTGGPAFAKFFLHASELWIAPYQAFLSDEETLTSYDLLIVSAKCLSKGAGALDKLAKPATLA